MNSSLLWYATRATGLVSLVLLTGTVVMGVATASRAPVPGWPRFVTHDLHRRLSIISLVFLGTHVMTSVLDTYVRIGWLATLVPFTSAYSRIWVALGTTAVDLLLVVWVSSMLRSRIDARRWRTLHWLAYLCWPVAVAHAVGIGTDMRLRWVVGLVALCVACVLGAVGARVLSTLAARRRVLALMANRHRPPGVPLKRLADQATR